MIFKKIKEKISNEDEMYTYINSFSDMIKKGWNLAKETDISKSDEITFVGMGGSGIPGDFIKTILEPSGIRVNVIKNYKIPSYVKGPVFLVSYSGNTEETISSTKDAISKNLECVSITTDGVLSQLSQVNSIPLVFIPKGIPPRASMGYFIGVIFRILDNSGYFEESKSSLIYYLSTLLKKPHLRNNGKELAKRIKTKIPIVYTSSKFSSVGYRWKCQFNENSKKYAIFNTFPEMNHNEIMGYENIDPDIFYVIILRDEEDDPKVVKRMDVFKELLKNKGIKVSILKITGNNFISRALSAILIGDWASYYLAKEYDIDPADTTLIENFKEDLKKSN
ncbi:MAG: bifunctional phosphoglucose/phosphomannose isomerase [Candidatus Woesearchaeota archaeon]